MKHTSYPLAAVVLATLCSTMQLTYGQSEGNAKFSQLCDQFVKGSLALLPVAASQAGYHNHVDPKTGKSIALDAELDDVSSKAFDVQLQFYREWRERFQKVT